jgi:hypothetical protein
VLAVVACFFEGGDPVVAQPMETVSKKQGTPSRVSRRWSSVAKGLSLLLWLRKTWCGGWADGAATDMLARRGWRSFSFQRGEVSGWRGKGSAGASVLCRC